MDEMEMSEVWGLGLLGDPVWDINRRKNIKAIFLPFHFILSNVHQ